MRAARAGIALLLALLAVGIYAGVQQWLHGDAVTNLNTIGAGGAVWGLYVVGDGFFASVGLNGLAVACVIRVARARVLEPAAQLGVSLALAGLLASVICVLADLGRPFAALHNLALVGRARAPFFGTFTLVAGASLFASSVQLVLASRPAWAARAQVGGSKIWRLLASGWQATVSAEWRRAQVNYWLSLALLPLLLVGLAILAVVFSARTGRPMWLVRLEVVTFIVSGGAAACSLLLLALAAQSRGESPSFARREPSRASALLARVLVVLVGLTALLVVLGEILALHAPGLAIQRYARALLIGPWHRLFWAELALLFAAATLCLVKLWRGHPSLGWALLAACLVSAAVFIQRFLLLVAWQTHGLSLPWPAGTYRATWIEWGVVVGVAAAAAFVFSLLAKTCPATTREPAGSSSPGGWRRSLVTATCLLLGLAIASAGLALSAGLASGPFLDPILPGSPLVFLGGVFLMLSAALAYELIPERPQPK